MALGSILGAAVTGLAGSLGSKLFGSKKSKQPSFSIPTMTAGGLRLGNTGVTSLPERSSLVGNISSTFPEQANLLKGLRESVSPGMSKLLESRLAGLGANRSRSIGNLRENLARRRVLGSSFGADTLARTEKEFQMEEDRIRSESFLQELELSSKLIDQEFTTRRGEFQTILDEMNLQAEIATQLSSQATAQLGANSRLKQELDAKAAAGAGQFFGNLAYQAFNPSPGQSLLPTFGSAA